MKIPEDVPVDCGSDKIHHLSNEIGRRFNQTLDETRTRENRSNRRGRRIHDRYYDLTMFLGHDSDRVIRQREATDEIVERCDDDRFPDTAVCHFARSIKHVFDTYDRECGLSEAEAYDAFHQWSDKMNMTGQWTHSDQSRWDTIDE